MKNHNGFTLLEIMIVVILIGVLASMATASYIWLGERGRSAEAKEVLFKAYAGYQRLVIDEDPVGAGSLPDLWVHWGMSDPNFDSRRHFDYAPEPDFTNPAQVRAVRRTDNTKWLLIDLVTGNLTKSTPY